MDRFSHLLAQWLIGLSFCASVAGCVRPSTDKEPALIWNNGRAVGISIANSLDERLKKAEPADILVQVEGEQMGQGIVGEYERKESSVYFYPAIPFQPGTRYVIYIFEDQIASFSIPNTQSDSPIIKGIYPSTDTIPSNTLKLYVVFSEPMQSIHVVEHFTLTIEGGDTVRAPFLDLKPALWNEEGTTLTLWFDPGRVKRDLIPNKELGAPLEERMKYVLTISDSWKSRSGEKLGSAFKKEFFVGMRDSIQPNPSNWIISVPAAGSTDELVINTHEALDYLLLRSAISLADADGNFLDVKFDTRHHESEIILGMTAPWKSGEYYLVIENRLEDLAGNNLARPFDRDVIKTPEPGDTEGAYKLKFTIR